SPRARIFSPRCLRSPYSSRGAGRWSPRPRRLKRPARYFFRSAPIRNDGRAFACADTLVIAGIPAAVFSTWGALRRPPRRKGTTAKRQYYCLFYQPRLRTMTETFPLTIGIMYTNILDTKYVLRLI